jgi:hypothetical protein
MATSNRPVPQRPEDCATAWFAVLERARLTGDRQLELHALAELHRLGVKVEWQEILAWLVKACREWQREGLGQPAEVAEATSAYRTDMDTFAQFLDECCVYEKRERASKHRPCGSDIWNGLRRTARSQ